MTHSHFYYFAYGSCMCPVDLKRTMGEKIHPYVVGTGILKNYRLGFYRYSPTRKCGVLDVVPDVNSTVHGVLYHLPQRLSDRLDRREGSPHAYKQEFVDIYLSANNLENTSEKIYRQVRTYVVVNKSPMEVAPDNTYFNVVLRGALTCGLPEEYCWSLFTHMHQLQRCNKSSPDNSNRTLVTRSYNFSR